MKSFVFVVVFSFFCSLFGFSLEAFFSNHDPGAVFPWPFVAFILAASCGLVGLVASIVLVLLKWIVGRVKNENK